MLIPWKSLGNIILIWSGYMTIVFLHYEVGKSGILTCLLCYVYVLIVSFGITKFLEKESIVERFGFQTKNSLGLFISICLGLSVLYYFNKDINNFYSINSAILAPLIEEIFYRGYMLGTFSKNSKNEVNLWIIILTSTLFSLGHIFIMGENVLVYIILLIFGICAGVSYVNFRTILWSFIAHMVINILHIRV